MGKSDRIVGGVVGVLTALALVVLFLDYAKNSSGVNQGLAIGGTTLTDLYNIAAGNKTANTSFSNLGALGG